MKTDTILQAKPFLKWAGGKGQLLGQINEYLALNFNNYIEAFAGAGALFFYLKNNGLIDDNVILIDSNEDLMICYNAIKKDAYRLINILKDKKYANENKFYYEIRKENPSDIFERAARVIYLNKTCFNGLYRVNKEGKFNVPLGKYKNPKICDEENLIAASKALEKVKLVNDDFSRCLEFAEKGDFIYFDPPYQPMSKTSSFTGYTKDSFKDKDQIKLFNVFQELDKKGAILMLSNSDSELVKRLYSSYNIKEVYAKRAINCNGDSRGAIPELLILNY
jgi:DNA adenine methylase